MKAVRFSRLYPKLESRFFNTIRRSTDLEEDEVVGIITPMTRFQARVVFITEWFLYEIPTSTLTWDTDTLTREEALAELQRYYPRLTMQSSIILIGFERLEGYQ